MKKYSLEQVYAYKKYVSTPEVIEKFTLIKNLFLLSTQYVENNKKDYTSKWKLKNKEDVVNIAYNIFNRITESNYSDLLEEICEINIIAYSDLFKLVEKIIKKIVKEKQFINLYCKLIKDIIIKSKWILKENNQVITFRMLFINKLQKLYINNSNIYDIIGYLFVYKVISIKLINNIIKELIDKNENENIIILWSYIHKTSEIFTDLDLYIQNIYNSLSKRLQFMILDIKENNNIISESHITDNDLNNYIEYIDEYDNVGSFLEDMVKKYSKDILLEYIIKYTIDNIKEFDKIKKIINEGIKLNYWNSNNIQIICNKIRTTELEDILIDTPTFKTHLNYYERL
jgi:hypothetical protein